MKLSFLIILIFSSVSCNESSKGPRKEGFCDFKGNKIWYQIIGEGNGIPILTLHGGPGGTSRYFYQLSEIGNENPVILFDQLGSGQSDHHRDTSILKVENFVEQVKALKDHLDLDEYYILGQSWGSALMLEFYHKYPEGIKAMIFSGVFLSTERWSADADVLKKQLPDSIQRIIEIADSSGNYVTDEFAMANNLYWDTYGRRNPWPKHPLDTVEKSLNTFVYNYMWGPSEFSATGVLKNFDNHHYLKEVDVPCLFIAGEFDEAREVTVRYYASMVKNSEVKIVPNAGHSSMTDNPEYYKKAVSDFLASGNND